jgi:catechol 2,3-dioxygenase-like lactoylglutathione lyase family enzyme
VSGEALAGLHHAGMVTRDAERLAAFYAEVFGASARSHEGPGPWLVDIGAGTALHVFEAPAEALAGVDDDAAQRSLRRGRVDHLSLRAAGEETFAAARDRLVARGAADGTVVDFGPLVSLFFLDPDGTQVELSLVKPEGYDPPFALSAPGRRP